MKVVCCRPQSLAGIMKNKKPDGFTIDDVADLLHTLPEDEVKPLWEAGDLVCGIIAPGSAMYIPPGLIYGEKALNAENVLYLRLPTMVCDPQVASYWQ